MLLPKINPNAKLHVNNLVSKPYIETTITAMKEFNIQMDHFNYQTFYVAHGQYSSCHFKVPADASSASYFFAGAFLKNKPLELNLGSNCMQGDYLFIDVLKEMGGVFEISKNTTVFLHRKPDFKGISVDMNAIPDTVQTLAVLSLYAKGQTKINNVANS